MMLLRERVEVVRLKAFELQSQPLSIYIYVCIERERDRERGFDR